MICYIKIMDSYYDININYEKKFISHKFLKDRKSSLEEKNQKDFYINFEDLGEVSDSFKIFDNFKFKSFGLIKKSFYIFFIGVIIMSIYYLPNVVFIYSIIYIILFLLHLYYTKNKNYIRINVYNKTENNMIPFTYSFEKHSEKMEFLKKINKINNRFLSIKTNFSYLYKNEIINKIKNKNFDSLNENNIDENTNDNLNKNKEEK